MLAGSFGATVVSGGGGGGLGAHKWWRIKYASVFAGTNAAIAEIEMKSVPGGTNQCTGGAATASSEINSSFNAAKAFDALANTSWCSSGAAFPQWIAYEFAAPIEIVQVTFLQDVIVIGPDGDPKSFSIEYSDDGVSYSIGATYLAQPHLPNPPARTAYSVP